MTLITSSINTLKNYLKNPLAQALGLIILALLIANLVLNQADTTVRGWIHDIHDYFFPQPATPITNVEDIIISGLQEMNELRTADITTKATLKVSQDRKISRLKIGDTNLIYEGVGKVEAGIDMKDLKVKNLDLEHYTIHLILPSPHLGDIYLDINSSRVVDKYKNWLGGNVEDQLQERAQKEALALIKAEACANGILDKASEHAQTLVKDILTTAGFQNITIDTQKPLKGSCNLV